MFRAPLLAAVLALAGCASAPPPYLGLGMDYGDKHYGTIEVGVPLNEHWTVYRHHRSCIPCRAGNERSIDATGIEYRTRFRVNEALRDVFGGGDG